MVVWSNPYIDKHIHTSKFLTAMWLLGDALTNTEKGGSILYLTYSFSIFILHYDTFMVGF